jgi:hypothetical protein
VQAAVIQRRHVFYVEGYDPQGAAGYHGLFRHTAKRSQKIWPIAIEIGQLELDTHLLAHWDIETSGPNWRVATRYEFLRLEGIIGANMSEPLWRQVARALHWAFDDLVSGTTFRIFGAAWRFGVHLVSFQIFLMTWIAISIAGGIFAALPFAQLANPAAALTPVVAAAVAVAAFVALRPLADRWFIIQINNCWPKLREFARGHPSSFDAAVDAFARRIVAAAGADAADEIIVVGHSAGGVLAPAVVARALEFAPDLGRCGPRIVLMTPGSTMPAAALHPTARRLRATIERIAVEPSILWIDCRSRADWLNFWGFDPVGGIGVNVGPQRRNPLIWPVRFRDMLSPQTFRRLRWNIFRMHYQFIMANNKRAPYDYAMLTCGPVAAEDWAGRGAEILAWFREDGTYAGAPAANGRTTDGFRASAPDRSDAARRRLHGRDASEKRRPAQ